MLADWKLRRTWAAMAAMVLAGALGCATNDDPGDTDPVIGRMVITIDGTDYSATQTAGGFGGQVALTSSGIVNFSASFYRPDGTRETVITADDFEVRVAPDNSGSPFGAPIEFERSGAFTGLISGMEEGDELTAYFSLFDKTELNSDFGPYFLIIRFPPPDGGGGGNPN